MDCRFLLLCFLALVAAQNSSNVTVTSPLACFNGPRSNCTASWQPLNLTLNVGQLTNLTLPLPCLPVLTYSLTWAASNGIGIAVGSLTNASAVLSVQDMAGNGGNFTVFVEWCDVSGYGNRSTTVKVITTNATVLSCINGPRSNCTNAFPALNETLTVGQIKNVTFNLPCLPVLQYALTWTATNGTGATVGVLTNTSASLNVQDVIGNGGNITVYVQWCDASGYGNKSTIVTLTPNRSAVNTSNATNATTVPTPSPTLAVNTTPLACQSSRLVSACIPVFQSVISPMNAGQARNLSFDFPTNCNISIFRYRLVGKAGINASESRVNNSEIVTLNASSNYNGNVTLIGDWCDSKNAYGIVNITFAVIPVATPTPTPTVTVVNNGTATPTVVNGTATPTVVVNGTATPTPTPSSGVATSGNSPSSAAATLRGLSTGAMGALLLVACVQFL